ncbi:MAG: septal ring lytic transglycosylase RlpA family protein [Sideroxydans sp.]|nr:septal ring lytic transglycosylase RlpA family protein [Sideroxydans sp.]
MRKNLLLISLSSLLLVACSSTPQRSTPPATATPTPASGTGGYLAGDGPDVNAPANLDSIPDAVVRDEPLHRYANRPYKALGKEYTPLTTTGHYQETGIASWYGKKFHGQRTSIGESYDMYAMSAAHTTLPIPSYARVTNVANGKSVIVRVNDRGPFLHERVIDLSYAAAHKLGFVGAGSAEVKVESLAANSSSAAPVTSPVSAPEAVVSTPLPVSEVAAVTAPAHVAAASGKVYLQLGAFSTLTAAQQFMHKMKTRLGASQEQLVIQHIQGLQRVRLGGYANADLARAAAAKLQARLGVKPFVSTH